MGSVAGCSSPPGQGGSCVMATSALPCPLRNYQGLHLKTVRMTEFALDNGTENGATF